MLYHKLLNFEVYTNSVVFANPILSIEKAKEVVSQLVINKEDFKSIYLIDDSFIFSKSKKPSVSMYDFLKESIDTAEFRKHFKNNICRMYQKLDTLVIYSITDIQIFSFLDDIEIRIFTHRPGLMIGKNASDYEKLLTFTKDYFMKNVTLLIDEPSIWKFNS